MSKPNGGFRDHPENIKRKGAPKKAMRMTEKIKELMNTKTTITDEDGNPKEVVPMEILSQRISQMLLSGDKYMIKFFWEMLDGSPRNRNEVVNENVRDKIIEILDKAKKVGDVDEDVMKELMIGTADGGTITALIKLIELSLRMKGKLVDVHRHEGEISLTEEEEEQFEKNLDSLYSKDKPAND